MALKSANQPIRWLQRIGILVLGLTANGAIVYWYDFSVYPDLIATHGLYLGWLYAVFGSIVLCLGSLWFYDLTKQDWIFIETVKLVRDNPAIGKFRKFFRNLANRGDAIAFLFLCLWKDAFVVTVYMRKGAGNYTMTVRDWKIFWAAIVATNAWWGMAVFGIMETFKRWVAPILPQFVLDWLYFIIGIAETFNRWLASFIPSFIFGWLGLT